MCSKFKFTFKSSEKTNNNLWNRNHLLHKKSSKIISKFVSFSSTFPNTTPKITHNFVPHPLSRTYLENIIGVSGRFEPIFIIEKSAIGLGVCSKILGGECWIGWNVGCEGRRKVAKLGWIKSGSVSIWRGW